MHVRRADAPTFVLVPQFALSPGDDTTRRRSRRELGDRFGPRQFHEILKEGGGRSS